jgi:hypothetical protein
VSAPAWEAGWLRRPAEPPPAPAALRSVATGRQGRPRAPFVMLLITLLAAGIAAILWLSTDAEQGAFALSALQARQAQLNDQRQALLLAVQAQQDPATLAARAGALGMVADPNPAFVELPTGLVSGDTPLAGQRVHLAGVPAGGLWVGPGGPPAPLPAVVSRASSSRVGAATHRVVTRAADTPGRATALRRVAAASSKTTHPRRAGQPPLPTRSPTG